MAPGFLFRDPLFHSQGRDVDVNTGKIYKDVHYFTISISRAP